MRTVLLLATAAIVPLLVAVGPSSADTEGCVSHAEYDNTVRLLSTSQIAGRYDTNGTYDGSNDDVFRRVYPPCWTNSREVVVRYSITNGLTDSWGIRDS